MMSVSYAAFPFTTSMDVDTFWTWVHEYDGEIPTNPPIGRHVQVSELKQVLSPFEPYAEHYHVNATSLRLVCGEQGGWLEVEAVFIGDGLTVERLSFRGNFEYAIAITQEIAQRCGTHVILTNGEDPIFTTPKGENER